MRLEGNPTIVEFDPFQQFQAGAITGPVTGSQFQYSPTHNPGERVLLGDGRSFRYAVAGASNLVAGTLQLPAAEKTNHQEINPQAAISAFSTANQVNVTLGATAATLNEYYNGFLTFSSGGNVGLTYMISYHPAANSAATLLVNPIRLLASSCSYQRYCRPYAQPVVQRCTERSSSWLTNYSTSRCSNDRYYCSLQWLVSH